MHCMLVCSVFTVFMYIADMKSGLSEVVIKDFNSFSFAAEITRSKPTWYIAGSYLRFSACYVDENNTIRFSEKFPIDTSVGYIRALG